MMELYEVMRTTPAVREFTSEPLPDEVLTRILDNARFAPNGGNRQGVRVIAIILHLDKQLGKNHRRRPGGYGTVNRYRCS